jgi:hypothetical protein
MPLNEHKTVDVEAAVKRKFSFYAEALRGMIMALSLYSIYWNWRREMAAERVAAAYGDDVPLGIG